MARFRSSRFAGDPVLQEILDDPDTGRKKLGPGSPPESVQRLQQALWDLSWVSHVEPPMRHADFVIGVYGPVTRRTVLAYKRRYDLRYPPGSPTGFIDEYAGPRTLARLDGHCVLLDEATPLLLERFAELDVEWDDMVIPAAAAAEPDTPRALPVAGTRGCSLRFEFTDRPGGGHVYHHPAIGTFAARDLDDHYRSEEGAGGPTGPLGFPIEDEFVVPGGPTVLRCQRGEVVLDPTWGAPVHVVQGRPPDRDDPDQSF